MDLRSPGKLLDMLRTFLQIMSLIALGAGSRLIPHLPNMTAMSAVALKSRAHFGVAGLAIPLFSMVIADTIIGFYDWKLLASVYASFALIAMLGSFLPSSSSVPQIVFISTVGSTIFFLVTNTVVWALSAWYPYTVGGLLACLAAGLPFYRYMLVGDTLAGVAMYKLPQIAAAGALQSNLLHRLRSSLL